MSDDAARLPEVNVNRIRQAIDLYKKVLNADGYFPKENGLPPNHSMFLLNEIEAMVDGGSEDITGIYLRLGFVQGILYENKFFYIDEIKKHLW